MSDDFTKYLLKIKDKNGGLFQPVIHHFTDIDKGENPHDHPWGFTTHILKGSYIEKVYHIVEGKWFTETIFREQGTAHKVITDLLPLE